MARPALSIVIGAGILLGGMVPLLAGPPEEPQPSKLATLLAVQRALQEGRDHLQRGNYQAAVFVLESHVARIDGNRDYLATLRDAYRGYVRELQQANRTAELETYLRRLEILDPGTALEGGTARNATPSPSPSPNPLTTRVAEEARTPTAIAALATGDVQPRPRTAITPRGKTDDRAAERLDDPFSDANRAPKSEARSVLDRAEREFAARHYDAAGQLFEQAHQIDAAATADCRERWAYCKVFAVVEALNNGTVDAQSAQRLEQQIRQAQSMSPKLDAFGRELLGKIQERLESTNPTPAVEVRHGPAPVRGWQIAETTNFRVFHRQQPELAERVARASEVARIASARKYFDEADQNWSPRCDIVLHATGADYAKATGFPAGSPGHSTIKAEGERILSRCVDLHYDDKNMERGVLPHEVTHVVLAGRFGAKDLPRWADEGMAVHSEPRDRVDMHLRNLPKHAADRQLFRVSELMQLKDYPEPRMIGPFYAQSVSLVEYLTNLRGPKTFAYFLRDALSGSGYEIALRKHYQIQGFTDLESRWQAHAFGNNATSNAVAERTP